MNLGLSNFGLKSYLWFQIELVLRARWILKSRIWISPNCPPLRQIYHYKYHIFELRINKWRWRWRINECDCIWMYVMCFNCGLITNKSGKVRSSRISNLCRVRSLNFNFDFSFIFPRYGGILSSYTIRHRCLAKKKLLRPFLKFLMTIIIFKGDN